MECLFWYRKIRKEIKELATEFDKRMKAYECVSRQYLTRRVPVTIRIDGKAFHTFTKGFDRPFDSVLSKAMQMTMMNLCRGIQGCVFGYTQSDEITLILIDYQKLESDAWFGYRVDKMCSIAASMATLEFNKAFKFYVESHRARSAFIVEDEAKEKAYDMSLAKGAMFDARAFSIPKEEVTNLIYWRQQDAMRNAVQMVGQAFYSHNELQGVSCNDLKEMLLRDKGIDWDDIPIKYQRGSCCTKIDGEWVIDNDIPIFKGVGRDRIEKLIYVEDEER